MLLFALLGCPSINATTYAERVQDVDNDGVIAKRFGGRDCDDLDPAIGDCDADRDGFRATAAGGGDCDDSNAAVGPEADEICDGLDNDCDGRIDDADDDPVGAQAYFLDTDGDGFGAGEPLFRCEPPAQAVAFDGDCNDTSAEFSPAVPERCDGVDWNCDGDPAAGATQSWFADVDGDGFGDPGVLVSTACERPDSDVASNPNDCDDTDALAHPADPASPDTTEVCDGFDNDCDGLIDDEDLVQDPNAVTRFEDVDGDGFGDAATGRATCDPTLGVENDLDCDDTDPLARPGPAPTFSSTEVCDGFDNDCDGLVDDDDPSIDPSSAVLGYPDSDGDGFGDAEAPLTQLCQAAAVDNLDCDDTDAQVNPGASEQCANGVDDDCDGLEDSNDPDNDGSITWYLDLDGDGVGSSTDPITVCDDLGRQGASALEGDCNDADATITTEVLWVVDADGDGFGATDTEVEPIHSCFPQPGRAANATDCDDEAVAVNPGAQELCNQIDDDCNGAVDDGAPGAIQGWPDEDGDGFGDAAVTTPLLLCAATVGIAQNNGDCDDAEPTIHPGVPEDCGGVDRNCDGRDDEQDPALDPTIWYRDADLDGFGDPDAPTLAQCHQPSGYVGAGDDCDDALALRYFDTYFVNAPGLVATDGRFVDSLGQVINNPGRCRVEGDNPSATTTILVTPDQPLVVSDAVNLVLAQNERFQIQATAGDRATVCWDPEVPLPVDGQLLLERIDLVFGTPDADGTTCVPAPNPAVSPIELLGHPSGLGIPSRIELVDTVLDAQSLAAPLVRLTPQTPDAVAELELLGVHLIDSDTTGLVAAEGPVQLTLDIGDLTITGGSTQGDLLQTDGPSTLTLDRLTVQDHALDGSLVRAGGATVQGDFLTLRDTSFSGPVFCLDDQSCSSTPGSTLALTSSALLDLQDAGSTASFALLPAEGTLQTTALRVVTTLPSAGPFVAWSGPSTGDGWTSRKDRLIGALAVSSSGKTHTFTNTHFGDGVFTVTDPTGSSVLSGASVVDGALDLQSGSTAIEALVIADGDVFGTPPAAGAPPHAYVVTGTAQPSFCSESVCQDLDTSWVSFEPGSPALTAIPFPRVTTVDSRLHYEGVHWLFDPNNDGLPVAWQQFHAADPSCRDVGSALFEPGGDPDGDGVDNLDEWLAGTWPCLADTDGDGTGDGEDPSPLVAP